jgi:peptidoglycan/LPS O-acetylase OafA/YrhL
MTKQALSTLPVLESVGAFQRGNRYYHPELDVLRFFAFCLVFLTHVGPQYATAFPLMTTLSFGGTFGVPLFFTLSSFLITELLLAEIERTRTINLGAFLMRRILRIWPLYFGFLIFGIAVLRHVGVQLNSGLVLSYFTLSANWYYALVFAPVVFIAPLWSISIEEQFYVIWSTVARFAGRSGLLTVAVLSWLLFLPVLALLGSVNFLRTWYDSLVQFQFFGLGAFLALGLHNRVLCFNRNARVLMLIGWVLSFYAAAWYMHARASGFITFVPGYLLIQLGCFLLLLGVYRSGEPTGLLRQPFRAAVWLGRISYGLYVYHQLAIQTIGYGFTTLRTVGGHVSVRLLLIESTAILVATILMADISYVYFEKPFLGLKRRFTIILSRED